MQTLRFAFRSLLKTPLVTVIAMLSLALGIGANAAIFSFFERVILQPLQVEQPERLVNLLDTGPRMGSMSAGNAGDGDSVFSYPMVRDVQKIEGAFEGVAAHQIFGADLAYSGITSVSGGTLVSGNYFELLGLRPTVGRLLQPSDDVTPGGHPVVVLAYHYWARDFGGDETMLGESLMINGTPMEIVGVAPAGFLGTTFGSEPDIFVPISMKEALVPGWQGLDNRRSYWAYMFARLAPGVSMEQATTAANLHYTNIIREVDLPLQEGASAKTLERFAEKELTLEPGARGQSTFDDALETPVILLFCVTGLVLLIACANIANLLLVKTTNRAGEIAVRLSIGAQRRQVVLQLLAESFMLAAGGAVLGLLFGRATYRLLIAALPEESVALGTGLSSATPILLVVLWLVTGLIGLFPALHVTRCHDLAQTLRGHIKQTGSVGSQRFRSTMAVAQIALSMALLVAAGLFLRSLDNVSRVDLGFEIDSLVTFGLSPQRSGMTPEQSQQLYAQLEERLAALPGVEGVTSSMVPLIAGDNWRSSVKVEGYPDDPDERTDSSYNAVGPEFFTSLGIPILHGRDIQTRDSLETTRVAIVNQAFVERFGLGEDAVGKRMATGRGNAQELDIEIVGVVKDTKYSEVKQEIQPIFYLAYAQDEEVGGMNFYIESTIDPSTLIPTVRETVAESVPNVPIGDLRTMRVQIHEETFVDRSLSALSAGFAILATLLAALGLYGVMAYSVAQRTREIGLRMALGADTARIRQLVMRQVGRLTLIGAAIGIGLALGLGKLAESLLFELKGYDPMVLVSAVVILTAVALGAGLLPAQRAASVQPIEALRDE